MRQVVMCLVMAVVLTGAIGCKGKKKTGGAQWVEKTETFYAVADADIDEEFPDDNYGSDPTCAPGVWDTYYMVTLLKWDLSSIPQDAEVLEVELVLNIADVSNNVGTEFVFGVVRVLESWEESTVTWNTCPAVATSALAYFNGPSGLGQYSFDFSQVQDFVNMVQDWIKNPQQNFGMAIGPAWTGVAGQDDYMEFDSKEGGNAPALVIKYRYQK